MNKTSKMCLWCGVNEISPKDQPYQELCDACSDRLNAELGEAEITKDGQDISIDELRDAEFDYFDEGH